MVREYGADSLRLYEMFMGPLEAVKPWNTASIEGVYRFLGRAWRLIVDDGEAFKLSAAVKDVEADRDTLRVLHRTIQKVSEDTEALRFNTAIAAMMEFVNHVTKLEVRPRSVARAVRAAAGAVRPARRGGAVARRWATRRRSPTSRGRSSTRRWPQADEIEVPVQINGKLKVVLKVPAEIDDAALEAAALADEKVKEALAGKTIKKTIVKSRKLVNLVVG